MDKRIAICIIAALLVLVFSRVRHTSMTVRAGMLGLTERRLPNVTNRWSSVSLNRLFFSMALCSMAMPPSVSEMRK